MSSTDSPSKTQPALEESQELGMRQLVLPPALVGLDAAGGVAGDAGAAVQEALGSLRRFHLSGVPTATPEEDWDDE